MAVPYGEISSITQKKFVPKMVDNIFASNPLFARWKKSGKMNTYDGGTSLMLPVAYAQTTAAGAYSGSDTLDVVANDQITAAEFNLKYYYASISINRTDELQNAGAAQIINFVKAKVQLAEKTLADQLGTDLFNAGTDAKRFVGLRSMVLNSGTYGGIVRSSNSWWNAQVSTATSLTLARMRTLKGQCTVDSDKPNVHITTQTQYDNYYGLLQPQQRFQDSETANGGFTNILFEGNPVIVDSHCPSGYWFMLNENYIEPYSHSDENFRFEPFMKPYNQNTSYAKIYHTMILAGTNCRMQGVFTSLT